MRTSRTGKLIVAVLTGAALIAGTGPAGAGGYDGAEFRRDVRTLHEDGIIGVHGRVSTERGQWTAAAGVADRETGAPVSPRSHFRIASNTKTFVAVVMLQLAGEGRLGLEDTVERHLPGLIRGNGNDGRAITIRQLLQHTSGLPEYRQAWPPTPEFFEQIRYRHFEPGELVGLSLRYPSTGAGHHYSNTNYVVAGMIIRAVTGNSWATEVDRRLIRPLGLTGTSVPGDDPSMPPPTARGYQQWFPGPLITDVTEQNRSGSDAAGAIISTTADLGRFFRALLAGRLLAPAQLAEMKRLVPVGDDRQAGYGLGLVPFRLSCGGVFWGHGGQTTGYLSTVGVSEDGRRSVVLSLTGLTGNSPADLEKPKALSERMVDRVFCDR
ncbi:serine hydrolase domain-containing protein [Amycolatopsis suaedae]|uniref:Class A beta-lactamase-related serine hydrolase n=1 Tax=Amycolatopsis suaedae TaxID=2510978 RepID=A0A4Q7J718_9PSEU|nr:serine hydrolase domain-containing protein [Amycolatopsis suaedae]RZQ63450.1 class A beta-lactamase-related serine hydrolase [Amycolatopsis suaedae]